MQTQNQNLIVCVDASASMSESFSSATKIEAVNDGVEMMLPHLTRQRGTMIGLVAYNNRPFVVSPLTWPGSRDLVGKVKHIRLGGSTNLLGGISLACDLLLKRPPQFSRRVIVLTDGEHNSGPLTSNQLIAKAQGNRVVLDTIGIGNEGSYNKQLLIQLAESTGGEFTPVRDLPRLLATFQRLSSPKSFRSLYPVSARGKIFHLNLFHR